MTRDINHLAVSCTAAAQKTLEVAIEVSEGGVTPAELPAVIVAAENLKLMADRLIATATASAARYHAVTSAVIEEAAS